MNNRLQYIDIAKGIVIILMVMGHSSLPEYPQKWIFSFHMPFFFMVSGMLTNWKKQSMKDFINSKTKSLAIPFFIYSSIVLLLTPLYMDMSIIEHTEIVVLKGWTSTPLWFVPVLYFALLLCKLIMSRKRSIQYISIGVLLIFTFLYRGHNQLPWTIYTIPYASTFVLIGAMAKDNIFKIQTIDQTKLLSIISICAILSFVAPIFSEIDMCYNRADNFLVAYIGAIAGSLLILACSLVLQKYASKWFSWLTSTGRNTFVVLSFSEMIIV